MTAPTSSSLKFCPVRSFWQPVLQVWQIVMNLKRYNFQILYLIDHLDQNKASYLNGQMNFNIKSNVAACLLHLGKWVLTPDYVLDSVKNGAWLEEGPYEIAIVRQWRENVASGRIKGAFQGWKVLLMVQEPTRRDMFKR